MNVHQLKNELKKRGLETAGKKVTLTERLLVAVMNDHTNDEISIKDDADCNQRQPYEYGTRNLQQRKPASIHSEETEVREEYENIYGKQLAIKDIVDLLPMFDPADVTLPTAKQFVRDIKAIKEIYRIDDRMMLIAMVQRLRGAALLWYRSVQFGMRTLDQFVMEFLENFGVMYNEVDIHEKLRNHVRGRNQDVILYYYEMINIAAQSNISEAAQIRYIIQNINDHDLNNSLRSSIIENIDDLLKRLKWHISTKQRQPIAIIRNNAFTVAESQKSNVSTATRVNTSYIQRNITPNAPNSSNGRINERHNTSSRPNREVECYNCFEKGHISVNCPKPPRRERCKTCSKVHGANSPPCNALALTGNQHLLISPNHFRISVVANFENN